MGIAYPASLPAVPARAHGHKHWLEYTLDEQPSQYHVVVRFEDAQAVYIGSASIIFSPGTIRAARKLSGEDAEKKFADIVERYEKGKTPDEMLIWMEQNALDEIVHAAWKSARAVMVSE